MASEPAAAAYRESMHLYEHHDFNRALNKLREAVELDSSNPNYMSALGLMISRVQKNYPLAEKLCSQAIRKKHNSAQLYLNLAEVYEKARKKDMAVATLRNGLKYTKRDPKIKQQIEILGMRRLPVLPFLDRANPINHLLGRIRHAILPRPTIH